MMYNFLSSINALIYALTCRLTVDPQAGAMQRAVRLVTERDDGLDDDDRMIMFQLFANSPTLVHVYLALSNESMRKLWLKTKVEEEKKRAEGLMSMGCKY